MAQIIICPERTKIVNPVIFLAGPIQGAHDWQSSAIEMLKNHPVTIASPRRQGPRPKVFTRKDYNTQVDWEHDHLNYAFGDGVVLFWLANESEHDCERAYAQTSRFELGWAFGVHLYRAADVVVGIDSSFTNEKYIRKTLREKAPGISICNSLEATCDMAAMLALL